jgi:hypothetical protein
MQSSSLQPQKTLAQLPEKLPIKVVLVLSELDDQKNEALQTIRKYCVDQNLVVETRTYDSNKYNHDRDQIARLPALHLYVKNIHQITFYPNGRPIQIIQATMEMYVKRQQEKMEKKGQWRGFLTNIRSAWKRMTHRKTRLEKQQEIDEAMKRQQVERRRSQSFRDRMPSLHDWE